MDSMPPVATAEEWQRARDELLEAEKAATRTLDALAARRRRLPMVAFDSDRYVFSTSTGTCSLLDLFDGHRQLVVYQFMDVGPDDFCPGCTHFTRNVVDLGDLEDAGVAWSTCPTCQSARSRPTRPGWVGPCHSCRRGHSFSQDCGAGGGFMLSVFLRNDGDVYRTYATTARGVDRLLFVNNILDLVPFGRQEDWEDSPPGWPQHPTYG